MAKKSITLTIEFEEVVDEDLEESYLEAKSMHRITDLSDEELDSLGESIAQSDYWQVDNWIKIQSLLGDSATDRVEL